MKKHTNIGLVTLVAASLVLAGCATTGGAIESDLSSGLVVAADVYTAVQAVQQNNTGKPMNAATVLDDARAAATSANTTGLATAVQTLVTEVNGQISPAATPAQNIAVVNNTTVAAQAVASN